MKNLTCVLLLVVTGSHFAAAADGTPPAATTAPDVAAVTATTTAPVVAPAFELKQKSSFDLEENGRNPFWPIGWKPAPKKSSTAGVETAGPEVSATAFAVTSITVDVGGRFAIINGKAMTEGQVFGLQMGNQTYQITVKSIDDGRVILLRRDEEIEVPLRRR